MCGRSAVRMNTLLDATATGETLAVEASSSMEKLSKISVLVLWGDRERPYELAVIENTPEGEKLPTQRDLQDRLHPMPSSITISSGLSDDRDLNILRLCFVTDWTDTELVDDDDFNFLNPIFSSPVRS
jgi:hypothetical protein